MAGVKGKSGPKQEKPFREALMLAIKEAGTSNPRSLRSIARKLIEQAEAGNIQAIQEIANRLDGKPSQQVEVTGEGGGPVQIDKVERVVIDPKN